MLNTIQILARSKLCNAGVIGGSSLHDIIAEHEES